VKPELSSRQSECQRQGAKTDFAQVQAAICARQEQMHDGSVTAAAITLSAQICIEMNEHAVTFLPPWGPVEFCPPFGWRERSKLDAMGRTLILRAELGRGATFS
jgi:hypothetical protein